MTYPTPTRPTRIFPRKLRLLAGLLPFSLLAALPHAAAETFEERRQALLEAAAAQDLPSPGGVGRQPYGLVVARLALDPSDSEAINYLATSPYGGGDWFFNALGNVRALYMAWEHMTPAQRNAVANRASDHNQWFNTGTENHRLMSWSSAYLYAQKFPDRQWNWGDGQISSEAMMERAKEVIAIVGRNRYLSGYSEFLSPIYEIYHITPMVNLYDYAEDPEVRAIAEAFLHYHFTNLAMASLREYTLPPFSRRTEQSASLSARIQSILWLYFGHGNPSLPFNPGWTTPQLAVSGWRPHPITDTLGREQEAFSYTARWQQAHFLADALAYRDPETDANTFRYVVRTTHHNHGIAMSSGVIRHIPAAFQLDDSMFSVSWAGTVNNRLIKAFHPYWRSASRGENAWSGATSPFMQIGQHKNAAILLFDIPAEDPWEGIGQWAAERDGPMRPLGQIRYSNLLILGEDFGLREDNWYFLRSGSYYIGIKALRDGVQRDLRSLQDDGFEVLKSRGTVGEPWSTGFIVEIGNAMQFGDFETFQEVTAANPVEVDWDNVSVQYTSNDGADMEMEFNRSLDTPDGTIPTVRINGDAIDYTNWPVIESPWVLLDERVFDLGGPLHGLRIDWSGETPEFIARVNPDPYFGGAEEDAGRWLDDLRYGEFYDHGEYPWIYHADHGWQYVLGNELDWTVFDQGMERWQWVDPTLYPVLWFHGDEPGWFEYLEGGPGERMFHDILNQTVLTEDEL
ncbi:MAG: hypothetical protein JJU00_07005 [Opitutales bacterium]|nr:hypothetical protein [Opitutales bacterium]